MTRIRTMNNRRRAKANKVWSDRHITPIMHAVAIKVMSDVIDKMHDRLFYAALYPPIPMQFVPGTNIVEPWDGRYG